ncbi:hypothetical protein [Pyruvatibacter mobilis]|uniref:hypothetical protein n=1 Tax=Pyruvatibacter mobilis TaxID=1712261 RepID=UPI003BAB1E9E
MSKTPHFDMSAAPTDRSIGLIDKNGRCYAPCNWQVAGVISEDDFWIWWQDLPEALTEVADPVAWFELPEWKGVVSDDL